MADLFLKLLNLSLSASVLAVVVMGLRLVLKKAPRWVSPVLWGIVGVRLLFPISMESVLSLLPSAEPIPADIAMAARPAIDSGIPAVNQVVNPIITQTFAPDPVASANPLQILLEVGGWLWLVGVGAMLLYTLVTYLRLRRRVRTAVPVGKGIYACETVASPFVLGLFRPKIYLPFGLDEERKFYIVAHEKAHIRRRDHFWKPLGFTLLAIHWFNPLMWLSYTLLCRDIELACDERVIRSLGRDGRADYSEALLSCSVSRRSIAACPLAFGEVGVKARVKTVLNYKRPGFWMVFAAVTACVVFAVCFLTNPKEPEIQNGTYSTQEVVYQALTPDMVVHIERLKKLTLNPFELRLTPDGELMLRAPGEKVWQMGFKVQESELTAEALNEYAQKWPNVQWQGKPVDTIAKGWQAESGDLRLHFFITDKEEPYFVLHTRMGSYAPRLLYAAKLQLEEIDHSEPTPPLENEWGLALSLGDSLSTTGTDIFFWSLNRVEEQGTLYYSPGYLLEEFENGRWKVLNQTNRPGDDKVPVVEFYSESVTWDCGPLPDGRYRIGKRVWLQLEDGEMEEDTIYAEFTVRMEGLDQLTREDILSLLPKGRELIWSDFEAFGRIEYDSPIFHHWLFSLEDGPVVSVNGNRDMRPNNVSMFYESDFNSDCIIGLHPDDYVKAFLEPLPEGYTDHGSAYLGITMTAEDPSPNGVNLRFDVESREGMERKIGNQFRLWKKHEYGIWLPMDTRSDNGWGTEYFWEGEIQNESIDWTDRYGTLPAGEYRIEKEFMIPGMWSKAIYADFTITPPTITVEDILRLNEKGKKMEWSDLAAFAYTELPSILSDGGDWVHRRYEVDGNLYVQAWGPGLDAPPYEVNLQCEKDSRNSISLKRFTRWEVEDFIALHTIPIPDGSDNHVEACYGIRMDVEWATPTGLQLTFEADPPEGVNLRGGDQYTLARHSEEGDWWDLLYPLPGAEWGQEFFWDTYIHSQTIDWTDRYGVLPAGEYRITKNVIPGGEIYAEFTIEDTPPGDHGVTISVSEITPEHLLLKYHRSFPGMVLYTMPGFTLEKQTDQGWMGLDVGTWEESVGDPIDFDWYAQEGSGMFMSWDRVGPLKDGRYRIGREIATDRDLSKAQRFTVYEEFTLDTSGWVDGRVPLGQIPAKYHPEDGEIDGCLVLSEGIPRSSAVPIFTDFRWAVEDGEEASLRFVTSYRSEETPPYEVMVHDLTFDGSAFTLRYLEEGREVVKTYQYLKRFTQPQPENAVGSYISSWYVLTNGENLTMQTYDPASRALQQGVDPDHEVLFCEQTYVFRRPPIPADAVQVDLEFEGTTCVTVTDQERVQKILSLFANGELVGYEPKTHSVGTGTNLVLTAGDGEKTTIELDIDSDMARLNGEFLFYGAYDEPSYIEKLWEYLGIEGWPEAVYEKYPNCFRGEA